MKKSTSSSTSRKPSGSSGRPSSHASSHSKKKSSTTTSTHKTSKADEKSLRHARRKKPSKRTSESTETTKESAAKKTAGSVQEGNGYFKACDDMKLFGAAVIATFILPRLHRHWGKFIRSGQLGMIFAPRGTGKTFFVLALAIAMTTAAEFLGFGPSHKRRVIILDGEMDLTSIKERLLMVAASLKVSLDNLLQIFTPDTFSGLMPAITTLEGQKVIDDLIGKDWDVLFIDNYSAWSADGRESPESFAPLLRWMLLHKREGRTVIIVHHAGKSGGQRGTSKHEDALDFSISLKPAALDKEDGSLNFLLEWSKSRHLTSEEKKPFCVTLEKGEDGQYCWAKTEGLPVDERVKKAVEMKTAGQTLQMIADDLGVNKSTVSRWLKP